ncbi:lanthionine synthetase C family protein [Streptomyces katsurahamanus]|uniref:Lanthionine synthetase n=1 Tax=Streptomyces katsurahamanus TaxID=2577098 RepID=A0ABW9NWF2_9ACTN|nr:lanthionine synthetase C family protein [Streptomyces katsurahamanus]MQS37640.1 lanthionine synthetase [Streptomyces katsurahamanus]
MTAPALELLQRIAERLADPVPPPADEPWRAQSLAEGAAGIALLHIERARLGLAPWKYAHRWITQAVAGEVSAADTTGLFLGAPAVAFLLSTTPPSAEHLYADARATLHRHITELAHRRTDAALERIHHEGPVSFAEYDVFYGLTGIGAYLLRTDPGGAALERVLGYLVALTRPLGEDHRGLPGWWVDHGPNREHSADFPGGHGNLGVAHGITGPLLLLAQALRQGVAVPGQPEAIRTICDHLDTWQQQGESSPWWPEHLTRHDLTTGRPHQPGPARPSWCYGTTGIARAGQLAGIALNDVKLQAVHEDALHRALTDPTQLASITDNGLCHGWAGVYQTAVRAAHDAHDPRLRTLPALLGTAFRDRAHPAGDRNPGFLNGDAGTALALTTLTTQQTPTSGWDACLLID